MTQQKARIGIVTVSDRASRGEYEDLGGPAMQQWLEKALASPWEAVARVVPDEFRFDAVGQQQVQPHVACALVIETTDAVGGSALAQLRQ